MNSKTLILTLFIATFLWSCTKSIEYTSDYMEQTSGRYLFNQENVIDVYYENNKLFLNWGELKVIEPVILDDKTFFIADIYKKLHFVQHPETKKRYLSIISEDNEEVVTYNYLKVADDYKTPGMHLENKDYEKALEGYLQIREQDSTSNLIEERNLNSLGYRLMRKKEYNDAIAVLKMNVILFPESDNVYDSLGEAYLKSGDSLQAFNNYSKAFEFNNDNQRALRFIDAYNENQD